MIAKILLVDDDKDILRINSVFLQGVGYECVLAESAKQAYAMIEIENPDLIVLDILLPDGLGIDICEKIRQYTIAPVIFLTSLLDDENKVKALQIGGDDYMTKPYKLAELSARIHANLRRAKMHETKMYEFPPLQINTVNHQVFLAGNEVNLTQKEFQLLLILVENYGTTVTRNTLIKRLWGDENLLTYYINTLQVHVSSLRKKIIPSNSSVIGIKTIRNNGYCFEYDKVKD